MSAATAPAPTHAASDGRMVPDDQRAHLPSGAAHSGPAPVHLADNIRVLALNDPDPVPGMPLPALGDVAVLLLDPSPERARMVGGALVDEELARAARARAGRGEKFTAVRGTLRIALARELGVAPREVPIVYGEHGKPALDAGLGSDVAFNVSHTGGLAAIVLARDREVGVDVELRRPRRRLALLARAALTPAEHARFERLPEPDRLVAFLDAWSAKEAYSKLLGRGLGLSFDQLELDAVRSAIVPLPVGPRHSGALAA